MGNRQGNETRSRNPSKNNEIYIHSKKSMWDALQKYLQQMRTALEVSPPQEFAIGLSAARTREAVLKALQKEAQRRMQFCVENFTPELDLSGLALVGLPDIPYHSSLLVQRLDISYNSLAVLTDGLFNQKDGASSSDQELTRSFEMPVSDRDPIAITETLELGKEITLRPDLTLNEFFKKFITLRSIAAQGSQLLGKLPSSILQLQHLRELDIRFNGLHDMCCLGEVKHHSLKLEKLEILLADGAMHLLRSEKKIFPKSLGVTCPNLTVLDLSHCGLESISELGLNQLQALKEFKAAGNHISDIHQVSFPKSLQQLDLSYNNIQVDETFIFPHFPHLTRLHLHGNPNFVLDVFDIIQSCPSLLCFDCSYTSTRISNGLGNTDHNSLTHLYLNGIGVENIEILASLLGHLPKLIVLELRGCSLSNFASCDLLMKQISSLKQLDLSCNCLADDECHATNFDSPNFALETLDLSFNQYLAVPRWCARLKNLQALCFHGNPIRNPQLLTELPQRKHNGLESPVAPEEKVVNSILGLIFGGAIGCSMARSCGGFSAKDCALFVGSTALEQASKSLPRCGCPNMQAGDFTAHFDQLLIGLLCLSSDYLDVKTMAKRLRHWIRHGIEEISHIPPSGTVGQLNYHGYHSRISSHLLRVISNPIYESDPIQISKETCEDTTNFDGSCLIWAIACGAWHGNREYDDDSDSPNDLDLDKLCKDVTILCQMTHNTPFCIAACQVTAIVVALMLSRNEVPPQDIKRIAIERIGLHFPDLEEIDSFERCANFDFYDQSSDDPNPIVHKYHYISEEDESEPECEFECGSPISRYLQDSMEKQKKQPSRALLASDISENYEEICNCSLIPNRVNSKIDSIIPAMSLIFKGLSSTKGFREQISEIALKGEDAEFRCLLIGAIMGIKTGFSNLPIELIKFLVHKEYLSLQAQDLVEKIILNSFEEERM